MKKHCKLYNDHKSIWTANLQSIADAIDGLLENFVTLCDATQVKYPSVTVYGAKVDSVLNRLASKKTFDDQMLYNICCKIVNQPLFEWRCIDHNGVYNILEKDEIKWLTQKFTKKDSYVLSIFKELKISVADARLNHSRSRTKTWFIYNDINGNFYKSKTEKQASNSRNFLTDARGKVLKMQLVKNIEAHESDIGSADANDTIQALDAYQKLYSEACNNRYINTNTANLVNIDQAALLVEAGLVPFVDLLYRLLAETNVNKAMYIIDYLVYNRMKIEKNRKILRPPCIVNTSLLMHANGMSNNGTKLCSKLGISVSNNLIESIKSKIIKIREKVNIEKILESVRLNGVFQGIYDNYVVVAQTKSGFQRLADSTTLLAIQSNVKNDLLKNAINNNDIDINHPFHISNVEKYLNDDTLKKIQETIDGYFDLRPHPKLRQQIATSSPTPYREEKFWESVVYQHNTLFDRLADEEKKRFFHFIVTDMEGTNHNLRIITRDPDMRKQYCNRQTVPGAMHLFKNTLEGHWADPYFLKSHQGALLHYCFQETRFKAFHRNAEIILKHTHEYYQTQIAQGDDRINAASEANNDVHNYANTVAQTSLDGLNQQTLVEEGFHNVGNGIDIIDREMGGEDIIELANEDTVEPAGEDTADVDSDSDENDDVAAADSEADLSGCIASGKMAKSIRQRYMIRFDRFWKEMLMISDTVWEKGTYQEIQTYAKDFTGKATFEEALAVAPNDFQVTWQYFERIKIIFRPFHELEDGSMAAFMTAIHQHLIYLAVYYEKRKVAREMFVFFNNIQRNLETRPEILKYWASNCRTMFNDEMIELTHSVFSRSMKAGTKVSNETIGNKALLRPTYNEIKERMSVGNPTYCSHIEKRRGAPNKPHSAGLRLTIKEFCLCMVRCSLLNKIPDCPQYADTIEKVKNDKVVKLVATKTGKLTGIKTVLDEMKCYINKIVKQRKKKELAEQERVIGDMFSHIQSKKDLLTLLNSKKDNFRRRFPQCKKNLYKRGTCKSKEELRWFLRAREKILEEIEKDGNNEARLKIFLVRLDEAYKSDPSVDINPGAMKTLYLQSQV